MESHKKLGILGILKEALFAGVRACKISAGTTILVLVLIHFLTSFFQNLAQHFVLDLTPITSQLPLIKRAFPDINQVEFKIFPVELILSELLALLNVHLAVMSCNESHFRMKELMLKINRTWKGLVITNIYTILVSCVSSAILIMLAFFLKMMPVSSLVLLIIICIALLVLIFSAIYISALLVITVNVSLVVTVVEESCCGYRAVLKAAGLIRRRKLHGIAISGVVFLIDYLISKFPSDEQGGLMLKLVLKVVDILCLFYVQLIYTVYYRECKKSYERGKDEVEAAGMFSLLPYTSNIEIAP